MPRLRNLLRWLGFLLLVAAVLFLSAGRYDLPPFWIYLGLLAAALMTITFRVDPELFEERLRPGPGGQDHFSRLVVMPLFFVFLVLTGLDVGRFGWSGPFPLVLQAAGFVGCAAALGGMAWILAVNRFFSSVVRIQTDRGHHLITTGPYGVVRHPGYLAGLTFAGCSSLALGSWVSLLPFAVLVPVVLRRTALEDRVLRQGLAGYPEYARQVRYRLVPGIW